MSNELTHWKKLTNPDYIGSHDFKPGQELEVTIEKVTKAKLKNNKGKDEERVICYYVGAKKPMVLNKTNMKIITKVLGTPYVEQWIGGKITLYVTQADAFGEMVDCIRVRLTLNK